MIRSIVSFGHAYSILNMGNHKIWPACITGYSDEHKRKKRLFWTRQITGNLAFGAIIFAVARVPIGIAMIFKQTAPFWAAILSYFINADPVSWQ